MEISQKLIKLTLTKLKNLSQNNIIMPEQISNVQQVLVHHYLPLAPAVAGSCCVLYQVSR